MSLSWHLTFKEWVSVIASSYSYEVGNSTQQVQSIACVLNILTGEKRRAEKVSPALVRANKWVAVVKCYHSRALFVYFKGQLDVFKFVSRYPNVTVSV